MKVKISIVFFQFVCASVSYGNLDHQFTYFYFHTVGHELTINYYCYHYVFSFFLAIKICAEGIKNLSYYSLYFLIFSGCHPHTLPKHPWHYRNFLRSYKLTRIPS